MYTSIFPRASFAMSGTHTSRSGGQIEIRNPKFSENKCCPKWCGSSCAESRIVNRHVTQMARAWFTDISERLNSVPTTPFAMIYLLVLISICSQFSLHVWIHDSPTIPLIGRNRVLCLKGVISMPLVCGKERLGKSQWILWKYANWTLWFRYGDYISTDHFIFLLLWCLITSIQFNRFFTIRSAMGTSSTPRCWLCRPRDRLDMVRGR
jgi:hypothetical protein